MKITNNKFKVLDCTLRDGGYYTNWDFDKSLVRDYCKAMEESPIDYVEIGYRSISLEGYLGEYFYCPEYLMKALKKNMPSKKLVIILDEKNIRLSDLPSLLEPCKKYIKMVRMAVAPKNLDRAIILAKEVKKMGFEVAFNIMYMSTWKDDFDFLDSIEKLNNHIDYFYMVDSYGAVLPEDIGYIMDLVSPKLSVPLGFHGHNNLEMALINTITAIEKGCEIVDCTITGMGRGAGNLRTELFLTLLNSKNYYNLNYVKLSKTVADFEELKRLYHWGTNMPYMFSGSFSLPQKQVMEWVGLNRYPVSSIVNALNNQKDDVQDNLKLPPLKSNNDLNTAIILGGGKSVTGIKEALKRHVKDKTDICIIHAGVRHVKDFIELDTKQYFALVGFESEKLLEQLGDNDIQGKTCVYPPYPRKMGTVIPEEIKQNCVELKEISFTKSSDDSPMAIAVQMASDLGVKEVLLAGFDGYDVNIDRTQFILAKENQSIINDFKNLNGIRSRAITPTKYKNIEVTSIYSFI